MKFFISDYNEKEWEPNEIISLNEEDMSILYINVWENFLIQRKVYENELEYVMYKSLMKWMKEWKEEDYEKIKKKLNKQLVKN